MKKSLGFSIGTVLATLAMITSLGVPAGAEGHQNYHHSSHQSNSKHITNSYNTDTTTNTETTTNTITTTTTTSKTKTNSGIIQKAGGGESEGQSKQVAIQGNYSGLYKVNIDQHQTTSQLNSNSNTAGAQVNEASVDHNLNAGLNLLNEEDNANTTTQTNNLTNDSSQSLSQSNSNNQSQTVGQTATGVSL